MAEMVGGWPGKRRETGTQQTNSGYISQQHCSWVELGVEDSGIIKNVAPRHAMKCGTVYYRAVGHLWGKYAMHTNRD